MSTNVLFSCYLTVILPHLTDARTHLFQQFGYFLAISKFVLPLNLLHHDLLVTIENRSPEETASLEKDMFLSDFANQHVLDSPYLRFQNSKDHVKLFAFVLKFLKLVP